MRFFGKSAMILAIVTITALLPAYVSAQAPQPDAPSTGHRVAVVDVAFIFKNHPGIREEVLKVENDLKNFDQELRVKQAELKEEAL